MVKIHQIVKCTVSAALNQDFRDWKDAFRTLSEEHSILRRDAMNFVYYLICVWLSDNNRRNDDFPDINNDVFWNHCLRQVAEGRTNQDNNLIAIEAETGLLCE